MKISYFEGKAIRVKLEKKQNNKEITKKPVSKSDSIRALESDKIHLQCFDFEAL